jgi:hypothetical protein
MGGTWTTLLGKTMSFAFGAKLVTTPHLQVYHTLSKKTQTDTHTLCHQVWYRVCGVYLLGGRSEWIPSRSDDSRSKSLDHLSRFKTEEPRSLLSLFSTYATWCYFQPNLTDIEQPWQNHICLSERFLCSDTISHLSNPSDCRPPFDWCSGGTWGIPGFLPRGVPKDGTRRDDQGSDCSRTTEVMGLAVNHPGWGTGVVILTSRRDSTGKFVCPQSGTTESRWSSLTR